MRELRTPTNGTATVTTTSTQVLPANGRRSFAVISNSGTVGVWLSLGEAAVVGQGIYLAPNGGFLIIDPEGMWRGAVFGIAGSGSNVVGTLDLQ